MTLDLSDNLISGYFTYKDFTSNMIIKIVQDKPYQF